MIRKSVLIIVAIILATACGGEESRVRSAVESTFMACQRGDISFALEYLHSTTDTATMLYGIQEEDAAAYDRTLAELGSRSKTALAGVTLKVESIQLTANAAEVELSLHKNGNEMGRQSIPLILQDGSWKLLELPKVPLE